MELHTDTLASAFVGSGLVILIAKYAIAKALSDLEKLADKVTHMTECVAIITVRLEKLADHETSIKEHSKKISFLEGLTNEPVRVRPL